MPLPLPRALSPTVLSLGFGLVALTSVACSPAASPARSARAEAPLVHFEAPREAPRESPVLGHDPGASRAKEARVEAPAMLYPPEVVHEARIELAREALDADNQAKAETEETEQMQRDIAEAPIDPVAIRHTPRPH